MDSSFAGVYEAAEWYAIAFGYRDVPKECDFLTGLADEFGCGAGSFLELACGPGFHALEMARRGVPSAGLDLEPSMVRLLEGEAARENLTVTALQADMRSFEVETPFHLVTTLLDSCAHLLTNEDMLAHLNRVAAALVPGGIYVLEFSHPADCFGVRKTAGTDWTMKSNGTEVHMQWGKDDDPFDPITEISDVTVTLDVTEEGREMRTLREVVRTRSWTYQTLRALLDQTKPFTQVAWYGALDRTVPFDNAESAWRMVAVLRRTDGRRDCGRT
ncbi:MAG: class I SAM-dependent methyltransferase [Candidatus Eisenbacteria bacterium]|uniref:Class I SAM-dependent methyltransferase n=1 Tax=Eiseniibacteriota bacterium TaxID=2212470 RepID=A0A956NHS7_UNCEI|nr:class I SAM-dependent methyltransferase [Candidatus Eisenbacteria bacterium]